MSPDETKDVKRLLAAVEDFLEYIKGADFTFDTRGRSARQTLEYAMNKTGKLVRPAKP